MKRNPEPTREILEAFWRIRIPRHVAEAPRLARQRQGAVYASAMKSLKRISCVLLAIGLGACGNENRTEPSANPDSVGARTEKELSRGYALLYEIAYNQSNVDLLNWIKEPGEDVEALANDTSDYLSDLCDTLETWEDENEFIDLENGGLPAIERQARDALIERMRNKSLSQDGEELRETYTTSLQQTLTYAADLAQALANNETSPQRAETLRNWESRLRAFESQVEPIER